MSLPQTKTDELYSLWTTKIKGKLFSGILVLCPSNEQDAKALLTNPFWQNFAEDCHLGLAAVTVTSAPRAGKPSHPASSLNPATLVLQTIYHEINAGSLPLVLYAWPRQADFAASLVAENPKRVLGWCLRAPSHLPSVLGSTTTPGIVVCQ